MAIRRHDQIYMTFPEGAFDRSHERDCSPDMRTNELTAYPWQGRKPVFRYMRSRWTVLTRYSEAGYLAVDNNRPKGRFAAADWGGGLVQQPMLGAPHGRAMDTQKNPRPQTACAARRNRPDGNA